MGAARPPGKWLRGQRSCPIAKGGGPGTAVSGLGQSLGEWELPNFLHFQPFHLRVFLHHHGCFCGNLAGPAELSGAALAPAEGAAGCGPDPVPRSLAPGLQTPCAVFPDQDTTDGRVRALLPCWNRAQVSPSSHSCGPSLAPGSRAVPSHSRNSGLAVGPASSGCDSTRTASAFVPQRCRRAQAAGSLSLLRHPLQHDYSAFAPRTILCHPPALTFCQASTRGLQTGLLVRGPVR